MSLLPAPKETIRWIKFWVDGGVMEANPSPLGVYWSMRVEDGEREPLLRRYGSDRYSTNNEAEWLALREALRHAVAHYPLLPVLVHSDSRLVVDQFNGMVLAKVPEMIAFRAECREIAAELKQRPIVRWCSRVTMVAKLGH